MTIGIDADGVLFDYIRTCANYVNRIAGSNIAKYESTTHFDNLRVWGVPYLKKSVDNYFSSPGVVYDMPVLYGAQEFLNDINNVTKGDFIIVTACPASWHEEREQSLFDNFGIDKSRVHFSRDKSKFKLRAMVDDYHMNLSNLEGWRILLDRPWNRDTEGVACRRCLGYTETICEISRIVNWNK